MLARQEQSQALSGVNNPTRCQLNCPGGGVVPAKQCPHLSFLDVDECNVRSTTVFGAFYQPKQRVYLGSTRTNASKLRNGMLMLVSSAGREGRRTTQTGEMLTLQRMTLLNDCAPDCGPVRSCCPLTHDRL